MTISSTSRQDTTASIVGGLLGGLVVAGSMIAFFTLRVPAATSSDESVTELRLAVAELRAQTAELRAQIATTPTPPAPPAPPIMLYPPPAPPPPPDEFMSPPPRTPADEHVSCHAEHACTLDRDYIIELIASPSQLARQMRIVPAMKNGEGFGMKVFNIRPGSLPSLLGYKNGDTILNINGMPFNNVDSALGAYTHLRRADTFSVELERQGQRLIKTCDLR